MFIFGVLTIPEFNATLSLVCHQRYSIGRPPAHEPTEELKKCFANKHAQSDLSRFLIYGQATAGLLGAFATPILSSLSDRVGRKPILACTIVGPLLYETLMVLVLRYPDWIDMYWLLVGYAIEGLSGTTITATAISQTYITDLTRHSAGARWFSYLQAAFSFAGAGGPIIAGLLLTTPNSIQLIYQLAMGAHIFLLLFILFVLPESRSPDSISRRDRDGDISESPPDERNNLRGCLISIKSIWESRVFRQKNMIILAVIEMIIFGNIIGLPTLQLAYPAFLFGWAPATQSFFFSMACSWSVLVLTLVFPPVLARVRRWKRVDMPSRSTTSNSGEVGLIQVNFVLQMIGYMGIALSQAPSHYIASSLILASTASITPLLISCLTAQTPHLKSGQLLGALSFLHSIARVVIPTLLNATYSMTIGIYPAPLFMLLSIIIGGLLLASMYINTNTL